METGKHGEKKYKDRDGAQENRIQLVAQKLCFKFMCHGQRGHLEF